MTFRSAVVFDLDGVLVDVRESYVRAAIATAQTLTQREFSARDFLCIKAWGGFNNDWDLTLALLWLAEKKLAVSAESPAGLREAVLGESIFRTNWADKVQDLFQQYYLGARYYPAVYGRPVSAPLNNFRGFIENEKPWLPADCIHRLPSSVYRVLLTGRPRPEALITLELLGLRSAFHRIVTDNEMLDWADGARESLHLWRKPSQRLARKLQAQWPSSVRSAIYLGDTRDDCRTARGFTLPLGFVRCAFEDPLGWEPALHGQVIRDMADLRRIF